MICPNNIDIVYIKYDTIQSIPVLRDFSPVKWFIWTKVCDLDLKSSRLYYAMLYSVYVLECKRKIQTKRQKEKAAPHPPKLTTQDIKKKLSGLVIQYC